jgi:DNA-3-methyladenine glycosylase II
MYIARNSGKILKEMATDTSRKEFLRDIPGIGPWTVAIFRIFILRECDVLPLGDLGLERAVALNYGATLDLKVVSQAWKPFRSVACWYLWRSLSNPPLG